jgi:Tol biopolymer transport system component
MTVPRRAIAALAAVVVLAAPIAATALAEPPPGPRIAFVRETDRPAALVIGTSDAALGESKVLVGGGIRARPLPYPQSGPAWSPDGSEVAIGGIFGKPPLDLNPKNRRLYLVAADGTGLHPIPHTAGGFAPAFAPDGKSIAFARTVNKRLPPSGPLGSSVWKGTTVWTVNLDGSGLRQLTRWRNGVTDIPSSFSLDGTLLGVTHRDAFRNRDDAIALRTDGRGSRLLARNAAWPRYSPTGDRIAYLGIERLPGTTCCELGDGFSVDLFGQNADGSGRLRLTDTPRKAERPASWDPSGQRLVYTTTEAPTEMTSGELTGSVMEINSDGTCPTRVSLPRPGGSLTRFSFPAWEPGPGRGAGRIAC